MAMFPGSDQYPLIPPLQEVIPLGLLPAGNAAITGEIFTVGMGRCTLLCQYAKTLVEPEKGEDYYLGQGVVLTLELSPYALDSQVPAGEAEWWPISVIQPTAVGGCFVNQNMMEPATVIYCGVNRDDTLESWTLDVSLPSHAQRLRVCARELDDSEGAGEGSFGCYALLSGDSGGEFGWTIKATGIGASDANPVPISDAGGSVTVDGTLEANDTPRAFATGKTHTPAADTAAVVTLAAAGAGVSNVIRGIAWGYSEDPTDGSLKIEDGAGTTVFSVPITAAGPGFIPVFGKGSANTALVVTLAAGGGTCVGSVNVLEAWTE